MTGAFKPPGTFICPSWRAGFDDHPARKSDIGELLRLAEGYSGLNRFLADMTLEPPNASMSGNTGTRHSDRLTCPRCIRPKGWNGGPCSSSAWPRAGFPRPML